MQTHMAVERRLDIAPAPKEQERCTEVGEQWRLVEVLEEPERIRLTWQRGSQTYKESLNQNAEHKITPPHQRRFLFIVGCALVRFPDRVDQIAADNPGNAVRWLVGRRVPDLSLGDADWKPEAQ